MEQEEAREAELRRSAQAPRAAARALRADCGSLADVALGERALADLRAAARRPGRRRRRSRGSGSRAPASGRRRSGRRPRACGAAASRGSRSSISSGESRTDSWFPRRSRSQPSSEVRLPDRDERVLQPRAPQVVRVHVAGRDGGDAERLGELAAAVRCGGRRRARTGAAARRRTRPGTRAQAARRRSGRRRRGRAARSPRARRALLRAARATSRRRLGREQLALLPGHARPACASVRIRQRFA